MDAALADKLVAVVQRLGLTFGAMDLVEDTDGEFHFLEVNPQGQWLWVEDLTELPISMAVARHLAEPSLVHRRATGSLGASRSTYQGTRAGR